MARYLQQRARLGDDLWFAAEPDGAEPVTEPTTTPAEAAAAQAPPPPSAVTSPPPPPHAAAKPNKPQRRRRGPKWKQDAPAIPPKGMVVDAPSNDLFSEDPLQSAGIDELAALVRECTACRLCENRTLAVPGEGPGDARLVVVGEGPGAKEDETGRPFVGRAGELLTEILAAIDLPREQVFICNVVKCRPPSNRKPQQDEIDACVPYLYRQIEVLQPAVILAMGGTAAETLLGTRQSLGALRNKVHEFRGTPLVVTYHPAALLRNPHWKKPTWDDVRIARQLLE
jgi:DNA polymerase